ncbi:MAG: MOSC domain-containing protein [Pseudomonadota bacterium]
MQTLAELMQILPQQGRVCWIGLRPDKGAPVKRVATVDVSLEQGLVGDRYAKTGGNRQVTLIQEEHLTALASMLKRPDLGPEILRRNIVVSGINLLALKDKQFRIGAVLLEYTAPCHPCSKMETILGPGGYNAMRGHGGICAKVISAGRISTDDPVRMVLAG